MWWCQVHRYNVITCHYYIITCQCYVITRQYHAIAIVKCIEYTRARALISIAILLFGNYECRPVTVKVPQLCHFMADFDEILAVDGKLIDS
jgi:hypothetical protein